MGNRGRPRGQPPDSEHKNAPHSGLGTGRDCQFVRGPQTRTAVAVLRLLLNITKISAVAMAVTPRDGTTM
jgi:hypothetical protein